MQTTIRREIVLATTNRGKLDELRELLEPMGVELLCLTDFRPLPDAVEDGQTFTENARKKAMHYAGLLNRWVLADDSGLEIDSLGGAPGVRSSRFAGVENCDPSVRDRANTQMVLELMKNVPADKRACRFRCCLCLADPHKILFEAEGCCPGVIVDSPKGTKGFGYDPIFYLPEKGKTIAELNSLEKNAVSHRGQAIRKLIDQIQARPLLSE
jgi:XTP/dITP diphosphohydrolase